RGPILAHHARIALWHNGRTAGTALAWILLSCLPASASTDKRPKTVHRISAPGVRVNMNAQDVLKMIQENEVRFVDLRFTDIQGKEQHVGLPVSAFEEEHFEHGHPFDGSSIGGWKGIQASDMILLPEPSTAYIDPFYDETTLVLSCDVIEPSDGKGYDRDPRSIAKRAEAYLKSTGIGDTAFFGPEPEFFIFDSVEWSIDMSGVYSKII